MRTGQLWTPWSTGLVLQRDRGRADLCVTFTPASIPLFKIVKRTEVSGRFFSYRDLWLLKAQASPDAEHLERQFTITIKRIVNWTMLFCHKRRWPQCQQARARLQWPAPTPQIPPPQLPPPPRRHHQFIRIRQRPRGSSTILLKGKYHASCRFASCSPLIRVCQMKAALAPLHIRMNRSLTSVHRGKATRPQNYQALLGQRRAGQAHPSISLISQKDYSLD